jgi:hypothetical protein
MPSNIQTPQLHWVGAGTVKAPRRATEIEPRCTGRRSPYTIDSRLSLHFGCMRTISSSGSSSCSSHVVLPNFGKRPNLT